MKISPNIIVGVQIPKLCEFYHDIRLYTNELNVKYSETEKESLIAMIAYVIEEGKTEMLHVEFYTIAENGKMKYVYKTDKKGESLIWDNSSFDGTLSDISELVNKQPNVYDLDYFLSNS